VHSNSAADMLPARGFGFILDCTTSSCLVVLAVSSVGSTAAFLKTAKSAQAQLAKVTTPVQVKRQEHQQKFKSSTTRATD